MAQITVVHTTEYNYRNPVGLLRHKLMVRPDESHDLRLHNATLKVEPEPTGVYWKHDAFNNSICFLEWPEALRTKRLCIVSTLDMTHHPDGQPLPVYSLDATAGFFPFSYTAHEIPDLARLAERHSLTSRLTTLFECSVLQAATLNVWWLSVVTNRIA